MNILKKIKQYLNDRHYAFIDDEQELTRYMERKGLWNTQGFVEDNTPLSVLQGRNEEEARLWAKTRYNRTDFGEKGLDVKEFCKKLDLMNNEIESSVVKKEGNTLTLANLKTGYEDYLKNNKMWGKYIKALENGEGKII